MATKGRNKPRVRGTKDMVKKVKNTAKKTLRSGIGMPITAGVGMKRIKEMMDKKKRDGKKGPSSGISESVRPKPRPKATSLRPKVRPTKKSAGGGSLKAVPEGNKGLKKLPTAVRNKMGYMQKGGSCRGMGKATRGGSYGRMG